MGDHKDYKPDRPVFCGNFEYDAQEREIERLFDKYGDVEKIDMKTGFAFVYMKDRRDGEDAIRKLHGATFGQRARKLRVEWASKPEEPKRENVKPTTTLFVVNFDSRRVRESDLQDYFCKWGRLVRVEIKKNYAFIQYGSLSDAKYALGAAHNSDFMGRRLSVEYVANEDPTVRRGGDDSYERARSPVRGRSRSPPRRRSPAPARRRSRSPYYGGQERPRPAAPRRRSLSPRGRSESPSVRRSPPPVRRSSLPRRSRSRTPLRSVSRSPARNTSHPPRRSYSR